MQVCGDYLRDDRLSLGIFVVGILEFAVKTDNRSWPREWAPMLADKQPLVLFQADPHDIATVPMLRELTDRIRAAPYKGRRSKR